VTSAVAEPKAVRLLSANAPIGAPLGPISPRLRSVSVPLRFLGALLILVLGGASAGQGLVAQDAAALSSLCAARGGEAGLCAQAATAADWFGRSLAAYAAHGAVSPDVQRTLGRRLPGGTPRVGFSLRPAMGGVRHPGLRGVPSTEVDQLHFGAQAAVQVGLFEGFQPYPTVGGLFAADVIAGVGWMWLPASEGYEGSVRATSIGARLGLLRESFTAPGVALTYARVWVEDLVLGPAEEVRSDPTVHALRLAVGKDLAGVGVHMSVGRDWVANDVRIGIEDPALEDHFDGTTTVVAAGASLNYLVVRLEAEAGWAFGRSGDPQLVPGFDPSEGTPLGALSVRVIF